MRKSIGLTDHNHGICGLTKEKILGHLIDSYIKDFKPFLAFIFNIYVSFSKIQRRRLLPVSNFFEGSPSIQASANECCT